MSEPETRPPGNPHKLGDRVLIPAVVVGVDLTGNDRPIEVRFEACSQTVRHWLEEGQFIARGQNDG